MAINFKPDQNYQAGGGVQKHTTMSGDRFVFNNQTYLNEAEAQAAFAKFQQQQVAQPPAPAPAPAPEPEPEPEPVQEETPAEEPAEAEEPTPEEEPEEEDPGRPLTIEERNRPIIDIMTSQAMGQGILDTEGNPVLDEYGQPVTQLPVGSTYTPKKMELQAGETIENQSLSDLQTVSPTIARDSDKIAGVEKQEFNTVLATKRNEVEDAKAAILEDGEISDEVSIDYADILGVVSANSLAQAQTAELDPRATVQGQLEQLYTSITEGGPLPPWASGPVRAASQIMQQRGLGSSTMAGAAFVQAVQESAIPIAAADAEKYSAIQMQNLSNRQQAALQNAATYATMDMRNADARTKAAIQNSLNFLQVDVANLSNEQATEQINFNANVQEMFTDQAAENAINQFNATGQTQVDQFFTQLGVSVDTRNAELAIANEQFNVDQVNAIEKFNQQVQNDRDKFQANLSSQIAQSNATWRRNINTANTAAQNQANQINAQAVLGMTEIAQANLWQSYRDDAHFLLQITENQADRAHQTAILAQQQNFQVEQYNQAAEDAMFGQLGQFGFNIVEGIVGDIDFGKLIGQD